MPCGRFGGGGGGGGMCPFCPPLGPALDIVSSIFDREKIKIEYRKHLY